MKQTEFRAAAIKKLAPLLEGAAYHQTDAVTYRKDALPTFGMMHLVDDEDKVMPRLSIGFPAVSDKGVVLSTDLHVLVSPRQFFWYSAADDPETSLDRLQRDFRVYGLPWLEQHIGLAGLTDVFEMRVQVTRPKSRPWWRRLGQMETREARRRSPHDLRVLSYCYDELGRVDDAVQAWRGYLETMTLGPRPEDIARLGQLEAKVRTL